MMAPSLVEARFLRGAPPRDGVTERSVLRACHWASLDVPSLSHLRGPLYDEDLHVNVGLTQLFQRRVVRVVVKGLGVLERRELHDDDGEGRRSRPFQGYQGLRGVAPDQRRAAVFCYQGSRLREICL